MYLFICLAFIRTEEFISWNNLNFKWRIIPAPHIYFLVFMVQVSKHLNIKKNITCYMVQLLSLSKHKQIKVIFLYWKLSGCSLGSTYFQKTKSSKLMSAPLFLLEYSQDICEWPCPPQILQETFGSKNCTTGSLLIVILQSYTLVYKNNYWSA